MFKYRELKFNGNANGAKLERIQAASALDANLTLDLTLDTNSLARFPTEASSGDSRLY